MKTNDNFKKNQIIWILAVVVLVMVLIKLKYGYRGGDEVIPTITPTVIPTTTTEIKSNTVTPTTTSYKDYPLWQLLPYSGEGFLVDKYIAPKTLAVKVKGIDSKLAIKAVEEWLKGLGEAGKGHKIEIQ